MAQAIVNVATGGGGGGGGGLANCTSQGFSVLSGGTIPWGVDATYHTSDPGGGSFGDNVVWLFQITPTTITAPNHYSSFIVSEYGGAPHTRLMSLSPTPCDFRVPQDNNGVNGPLWIAGGTTAHLESGSYDPANVANTFGWPWLMAPGTTYYLSIRNYDFGLGASSCGTSDCRAVLTFNHQAF